MDFFSSIFDMFMTNVVPMLIGVAGGYVVKAQNWLTKLLAKLTSWSR